MPNGGMDPMMMAMVGGGACLLCVVVVVAVVASSSSSREEPRRRRSEPAEEAPIELDGGGSGGGRDGKAVYPSQTATMSPMLTSVPVTLEWTLTPGTPAPVPPTPAPTPLPTSPTDPNYWAQYYGTGYYGYGGPGYVGQPGYGQPGYVGPAQPPPGQTWFTPEEMSRYFQRQCSCPAPARVNGGHTQLRAMTAARDQAICCKPAGPGVAPFQQCAGFKKVPTMGWVTDATVSSIPWPPMVYTREAKCTGTGVKGGGGRRPGGRRGGRGGGRRGKGTKAPGPIVAPSARKTTKDPAYTAGYLANDTAHNAITLGG